MRGLSEDARILWKHLERLKIIDGVLFHQWNSHDPKRLILPKRTFPQIILQLHESFGDLCARKTELAQGNGNGGLEWAKISRMYAIHYGSVGRSTKQPAP